MNLIAEQHFKKAFKRLIRKSSPLKNKILETLDLLEKDPFNPSLKSHKLTGNLANYWSCSVNYDYRIIFIFSKDIELDEIVILLVNISSHDEVY